MQQGFRPRHGRHGGELLAGGLGAGGRPRALPRPPDRLVGKASANGGAAVNRSACPRDWSQEVCRVHVCDDTESQGSGAKREGSNSNPATPCELVCTTPTCTAPGCPASG